MNQNANWVVCMNCGANNYPQNAVCWQCRRPLTSATTCAGPPAYQGQQFQQQWHPTGDTSIYVVMGFIFAFCSWCFVCCCPMVFAIPAVVFGLIAHSRGDKLGIWVVAAAAIPTLIWMALCTIGVVTPNWSQHAPP